MAGNRGLKFKRACAHPSKSSSRLRDVGERGEGTVEVAVRDDPGCGTKGDG
jgi:hypothetical protein